MWPKCGVSMIVVFISCLINCVAFCHGDVGVARGAILMLRDTDPVTKIEPLKRTLSEA